MQLFYGCILFLVQQSPWSGNDQPFVQGQHRLLSRSIFTARSSGRNRIKPPTVIFGGMSPAGSHTHSWLFLKSGKEEALHLLFEEHYIGLINYGVKLCGDRELATDSFNQVLLHLWEKREHLPAVENVRAYLLTCMRNQVLQELKARKRRGHHEAASQHGTEGAEWSYEEYLVRLQTDDLLRQKVKAAFESLTSRQRELLRLRFFEDLDYDEIARRCGITRRTAYNIIYDALSRLREELNTPQAGSYLFSLPLPFLVYAFFLHSSL